MTTVTQASRLLAVDTPLERDVLVLGLFSGSEKISDLFRFQLDLYAEPENAEKVVVEDLLGQGMTVSIKLPDESHRYFHGIVSRFSQTGQDERFFSYKAEIVPRLWQLSLTSDSQIFQDKTVPEIIKEVFKQLGFTDYRDALTGTYTKLDYCVQYHESHYNFICRLMEREGICFFFEHEEGKHTLVLADAPDAHPETAQPEARFEPDGGEGDSEDTVTDWLLEQELHPGKYTARDFNFQMPDKSLEVRESTTIEVGGNSVLEVFEYPGEYAQRFIEPDKRLDQVEEEGMTLARIRMEEEEAAHAEATGRSICRGFSSGHKFKLTHHSVESMNGDYVLTSVDHFVTQSPDYYSGAPRADPYDNSFTCIPCAVPFRPRRATPKPVMRGVQTAVVVGKSGEEIWTDKYGRVKVQFPWDRKGKNDENSSCWIRVSQPWAGQNWGTVALPRMGQEVLIDFVDGDADHPVIVGRVYNGAQMPPYALPANQTQSGMKSRSSKGGGPDNFNEIRFEDKKGSEEVYIHAEKDENIVVENCKTESVGVDESISIGNDRTETVGNNETLAVASDRSRSVGKNETVTVGLMRTHTVGINEAISVGAAQEVTVGATRAVTVGLSQTVNIGQNESVDVGKDLTESIGKNHTEKVGKNLTIDAGDQISIKTGQASITMKKDGTITIKGKDITIQGSGKITEKATGNIIMKGKKILQN